MDLSNLKDKNILILGAGKTGIATARFLIDKSKSLFLSESKSLPEIFRKEIESLEKKGLKTEFGKNSEEFLNKADLIVVSPGISPNSDIIKNLVLRNIPLISDVELASFYIKKPIIGITGTNGKTTTTSLITHIINMSGKKAVACGNIGKPLIEVLNDGLDFDYYVLELSSYQLYYSSTLSCFASVFTNFTPDHLDWHGSLENYFLAKKKLFDQQGKNSYSVLNYSDPYSSKLNVKNNKFYFSSNKNHVQTALKTNNFAFFDGETIKLNLEGSILDILSYKDLKILGLHNIENALASLSVAKIIGLKDEDVAKGLKTFEGVEHRIEFVRNINGKSFYNDSKATNPSATVKAIEAFSLNEEKKVTLFLGGRDKNTDLSEMIEKIKKYVSEVVLFGEAKDRFKTELESKGFHKLKIVKDLNEAIITSLESKSNVILFSPACASFDMFKNYEERGKIFKDIVRNL